jgi:hypothetical protein
MKLKILCPAALSTFALLLFAGTASATTLEVKGVKQTGAITIKASLKSGTSLLWKDTSGSFQNTCTASNLELKDSTATTGTSVSGPLSSLSYTKCTSEAITVHKQGTWRLQWIPGTTNLTVFSTGTEITVPGVFFTVTCTTSNTDMGVITGSAAGQGTVHLNAVINCGAFLPSAKLEGTLTVTSPEGLGGTE